MAAVAGRALANGLARFHTSSGRGRQAGVLLTGGKTELKGGWTLGDLKVLDSMGSQSEQGD